MTRRWSAGAASTSTRCGCGRRARPTRCASTRSTRAIMSARWRDQVRAEAISKVLYPSDSTPAGQELRLRQEYFFASASLAGSDPPPSESSMAISDTLAEQAAIQLNDTHPAIGVAELMRLLVDVHGLAWERRLGHHPGHLLLHQPHACCPRRWRPGRCRLMERLLPRHMQIIYLINAHAPRQIAGRRHGATPEDAVVRCR